MTLYLGADHRGFNIKEKLKAILVNDAYTVVDLGAEQLVPDDDYPDYALKVSKEVAAHPADSRGVLLCGSGFGMDIAANKITGIRAALPVSPDHAYQARHDDDVNVLVIAADFTDVATALKMVKVFLSTPFAKDARYERRLLKISNIEKPI